MGETKEADVIRSRGKQRSKGDFSHCVHIYEIFFCKKGIDNLFSTSKEDRLSLKEESFK